MAGEIIRQGDVALIRISDDDRAAALMAHCSTVEQDPVLALGEATGHAHVLVGGERLINGLLRVHEGGAVLEHLQRGERVEHPEHLPLPVPPGTYRLRQQMEWAERTPRYVHD